MGQNVSQICMLPVGRLETQYIWLGKISMYVKLLITEVSFTKLCFRQCLYFVYSANRCIQTRGLPGMAAFSCLAGLCPVVDYAPRVYGAFLYSCYPLKPCLLGEFKLTTANVLLRMWRLYSALPNRVEMVSYLMCNLLCWHYFCPEVKRKKIVSLDHFLPLESMPLTRWTDKRKNIT